MILKYNDKILEDKLSKLLDEKANERQVLATLKDLRYKTIDKKVLNKLLKYFINKDEKDSPNHEQHFYHEDWYKGQPYYTFMDFFSRKLTDEKTKEIQKSVKDFEVVISNECYVESIAKMSDTKKVLRLKKKTTTDILKDLKDIGVDASKYNYIDMKLLCSYYHRIHSPVTGKIVQMIPVEGNDDFFGPNSLWVLEYDINKKHPLYLLLVGESTIQDFDFLVEKNDDVEIFQNIGFFNWGSQTIILYHPDDFNDIQIEENYKYFVGDGIFKK
jgi:phosphatidylserine decarboxylase